MNSLSLFFAFISVILCDAVSIGKFYTNSEMNGVEDNSIQGRTSQFPQHSNNVIKQDEKKLDEPPCQIFHSPYGCCWDNRTMAKGPNGYGCPECKDYNKSLCEKYGQLQLCGDSYIRTRCPVTCQLPCAKSCTDVKGMENACNFYRENGLCAFMKPVCKRTCGFCCK